MKVTKLLASLLFLSTTAFAQEQVTLEKVIALALEENYDVRLSKNASESATLVDETAWGAYLPTIDGNATTLWTNTPDQQLEFADATRNQRGSVRSHATTASVQLNWILFDGTRMFATRERFAVLAAQGQLVVKDQMVNTIASAINNYYDIVQQKQQLSAIREQMAVSEERVKLAERKLEVGTGRKPELLQARVDYNAQRTQAFQKEAAIFQLKEQLNGLLGLKLPRQYDVADTIMIDLNLQQSQIEENIEQSNYALLATKKSIDVATLALRESRAQRSPVISFVSAYNYNRQDNTKLLNPFGTIFSLNNGFNYGFTLSVPILNGFNIRRQVELSKIELDRQMITYDQQKTVVDVGVRNAYVNYDNAKKVLQIEEETILLAKENVFIALETFKRGVSTFIELRTAQQSLADAYTRLISARYLAKLAETELLRLNGSLLR
ncbi:TolC family protein [Pseudochryseolinea flava]|nr:TolC family protein [Pseudochryseolinea flava]